MKEKTNYYVLKEKAVPDVLLRVVEAKRLLESGRVASVQEATERVDISRSSFYKYKEDIFPFHDNAKGRTITMVKDRRTGYETGNVDAVLDGELDPFINAYLKWLSQGGAMVGDDE